MITPLNKGFAFYAFKYLLVDYASVQDNIDNSTITTIHNILIITNAAV